MIALNQNNLALQIAKETGKSTIMIAALFIANQAINTKLREQTKSVSQTAAQGLKSLRSRYEEKF